MNAITPRERVYTAVRHQQPDRVPWHLGYTVPARQKLEAYYGTTDLDDALGNHLAKYRSRLADEPIEGRPGFWRDEFGVVFNRTVDKDIGIVERHLLQRRSLDGVTFPDPHDPRRYAGLPAFLEAHRDRFRYLSLGFSLFERAWILRGMNDILIDMLEAPEFVDELLDAILRVRPGDAGRFPPVRLRRGALRRRLGAAEGAALRGPALAAVHQAADRRALRGGQAGRQGGDDPLLAARCRSCSPS